MLFSLTPRHSGVTATVAAIAVTAYVAGLAIRASAPVQKRGSVKCATLMELGAQVSDVGESEGSSG